MPDVWPEGQVYKVLKEHGVHNIPDCISSGDIETDQFYISTKLQRHVLISKNPGLDVIGCTLTNFRTYEMVSVVHDAIKGLQDAHGAGFLHRDFSPSNIILTLDSKGLLIVSLTWVLQYSYITTIGMGVVTFKDLQSWVDNDETSLLLRALLFTRSGMFVNTACVSLDVLILEFGRLKVREPPSVVFLTNNKQIITSVKRACEKGNDENPTLIN